MSHHNRTEINFAASVVCLAKSLLTGERAIAHHTLQHLSTDAPAEPLSWIRSRPGDGLANGND